MFKYLWFFNFTFFFHALFPQKFEEFVRKAVKGVHQHPQTIITDLRQNNLRNIGSVHKFLSSDSNIDSIRNLSWFSRDVVQALQKGSVIYQNSIAL